MIVTGHEVARFAAVLLKAQIVPPYEAIGLEEDGEIVAAMVFNHWTGADIHVSVAARKGKLSRPLVEAAGAYVFGQMQCERATLITESKRVFKFGLRLGAADEGLCRNQFGRGRDGYRLAFHRDEWRY